MRALTLDRPTKAARPGNARTAKVWTRPYNHGLAETCAARHRLAARAPHATGASAEGFTGLSVLIRADQVIAETSADFHDAVESALTALCAEHPVRVLCVYDRPGAGTEHLDLAVTHHRGGLQEHLLTVRDAEDCTYLAGEVDMTNLDVFDAALLGRAGCAGAEFGGAYAFTNDILLPKLATQNVRDHIGTSELNR